MKTRIIEKRRGNIVTYEPQVEDIEYRIFHKNEKVWRAIKITNCYTGEEARSFESMSEAREVVDRFLFENGVYDEIIHWYPEPQK